MARRSRADRLERVRDKRKRALVVGSAVLATVAVLSVAVALLTGSVGTPADAEEIDVVALDAGVAEATLTVDPSSVTTMLVEVPDVTGLPLGEAELLLGIAGLEITLLSTPPGEAATGTVLAQMPTAGERIAPGSVIELVWADPDATVAASGVVTASASDTRPPGRPKVVCIDPGHQARANTAHEPIGPGASETKMKVTGGAAGAVTKQAEYELVLELSLELKKRLEARGITVVMTRTANDVDISNSQRAKIANDARADLFVRVHADSSTNADISGVSTLYPGGNAWVAPIEVRSLAAAKAVHAAVLASTGAADRGVVKRADLSGFNYATVPSVLVETGFLSNPKEDRLLADPAYRAKVVDGMAAGIVAYLGM